MQSSLRSSSPLPVIFTCTQSTCNSLLPMPSNWCLKNTVPEEKVYCKTFKYMQKLFVDAAASSTLPIVSSINLNREGDTIRTVICYLAHCNETGITLSHCLESSDNKTVVKTLLSYLHGSFEERDEWT